MVIRMKNAIVNLFNVIFHFKAYRERVCEETFKEAQSSKKGIYDLFSIYENYKFANLKGIEDLFDKEEMRQWQLRSVSFCGSTIISKSK